MIKFITKRILIAIPTLLIIVAFSFSMMRVAPGGPFTNERALPPEIERNIKAAYNLDKPVYEQFYIYIKNLTKGDFGPFRISFFKLWGVIFGPWGPKSVDQVVATTAWRLVGQTTNRPFDQFEN